jgi:hypothetical protein
MILTKKNPSIITTAVMAISVAASFAQGTVAFENSDTGLVLQWTSSSDRTPIPVPSGGGQVQLFWAESGTAYSPWNSSMTPAAWKAVNPGWSLEMVIGFLSPTHPGRFQGGALTLYPLPPGGNIDYVVVGWTGIYQSFDAAMAAGAMVNVSDKLSSRTGDPTLVPPGAPVHLANTFGGMTLMPVPEPSAFALAGLGAAVALFRAFRHPKPNQSRQPAPVARQADGPTFSVRCGCAQR